MSTEDEGHWDGTDPDAVLAAQEQRPQDSVPVWQLVVEHHDKDRWSIELPPMSAAYTELGEARAAAAVLAYEFTPPDPLSPQRRRIFKLDDDSYLVVLDGAMSRFHFVVRVAQRVGVVEY